MARRNRGALMRGGFEPMRHHGKGCSADDDYTVLRRECRRVRERIARLVRSLHREDLYRRPLTAAWNGFRFAIVRDREHLERWLEEALARIARAEKYLEARRFARLVREMLVSQANEEIALSRLGMQAQAIAPPVEYHFEHADLESFTYTLARDGSIAIPAWLLVLEAVPCAHRSLYSRRGRQGYMR